MTVAQEENAIQDIQENVDTTLFTNIVNSVNIASSIMKNLVEKLMF